MKYGLIFCDFDGTLLRDDLTVSEPSICAIKNYVRRGGKFVINTGRMPKSMRKWPAILGTDQLPVSVCGFQGGLAMDKDGNRIVENTIGYLESYEIIKKAEEMGLYVHTYETDNVLIEKSHPISRYYCEICDITEREVGKLSNYVLENKHNCYKIMMVVEPEQMNKMLDFFGSLNFNDVNFVSSSSTYLEAVPNSGGKGNALVAIADYYGIPVDQTIAIGDQRNDIGMIKAAGLGCAVANALEEVKKVSNYVSASNDNDGVREIIEKFTED